jgi:hypothetical protein
MYAKDRWMGPSALAGVEQSIRYNVLRRILAAAVLNKLLKRKLQEYGGQAPYNEEVKRLLQFGVLLLGLATLLTPLVEFFDRWDPPGPPTNDTELGVFGFILVLALVLLVSRLMAILDKLVAIGTVFRPQSSFSMVAEPGLRLTFAVVPHSSPPLRI